jgi:opine dehydrogenase
MSDKMTTNLIIGGGHVGKMLAYDLLKNGEKTTLATLSIESYEDIRSVKKLKLTLKNELTDEVESGDIHGLNLIIFHGSEINEEFKESENIFICVPDIPKLRLEILQKIKNLNLHNKRFIFIRGGQGWIPYLATQLEVRYNPQNCSYLMVEDSLYGCRFVKNQISYKRKYSVNVALLGADPLDSINQIQDLLRNISHPNWPSLVEVTPVGLMFDALGYIVHTAVILYGPNLEKTKAGIVYNHYIEGINAELCAHLEVLDQERVRLAQKFGAAVMPFKETLGRQYNVKVGASLFDTLSECKNVYKSSSPTDLDALKNSRAINEDISALWVIQHLASLFPGEFEETLKYAKWISATCESEEISIDILKYYALTIKILAPSVSEFINLFTKHEPIDVVAASSLHKASMHERATLSIST